MLMKFSQNFPTKFAPLEEESTSFEFLQIHLLTQIEKYLYQIFA